MFTLDDPYVVTWTPLQYDAAAHTLFVRLLPQEVRS